MKYLLHNRTNLSYREFLTEYHDLIYIASFPYISSLPFSNWKTFDDYWADKFLDEANDLIKEKKILKKSTIDILKEKVLFYLIILQTLYLNTFLYSYISSISY